MYSLPFKDLPAEFMLAFAACTFNSTELTLHAHSDPELSDPFPFLLSIHPSA